MATLSLLTCIGNAAAVLTGHHGAVTAFTQQHGCSRQIAYEHADKVLQAVADAQLPGPSRCQLLQDNQRLRQRLDQATAAAHRTLAPDTLRRLAVTAHALGLSLNQVEDLVALLPPGGGKDRSSIGRWTHQAARQAERLLEVLDRHARPRAATLGLDEIFFHGQPILVAVEPASMALLHCRREDDRTGPTWQQALQPFTGLQAVVRDAGSGLSAGLALLEADRQQRGLPPLDDSLDVFHTTQEAQRLLGRLWRTVEKHWAAAEAADRRRTQAHQHGRDGRGPAQLARAAWAKAFASFTHYERWEGLWRRAAQALEWFRPDGRLNDRVWAEGELTAVCAELTASYWRKLVSYLRDPRTLNYLDRLQRQLAKAEPDAALRRELVELWRLEHRSGGVAAVALSSVQRVLCRGLSSDWPERYRRVSAVLGGAVRASSVVECVNSILRMHQGRHRTVTQGMLDLKRLHWNLRAFRSGQRQKRCPYEHLGLTLPTYDFWEILQMDPQQLDQQLSTGKLAA